MRKSYPNHLNWWYFLYNFAEVFLLKYLVTEYLQNFIVYFVILYAELIANERNIKKNLFILEYSLLLWRSNIERFIEISIIIETKKNCFRNEFLLLKNNKQRMRKHFQFHSYSTPNRNSNSNSIQFDSIFFLSFTVNIKEWMNSLNSYKYKYGISSIKYGNMGINHWELKTVSFRN